MIKKIFPCLLVIFSVVFSVNSYASEPQKLYVTATAYNSVDSQTDSTPWIAAWGDRLRPGMKEIAVSSDLLRMGFTRGTMVKISGLPGEYEVLDKMNPCWRRRIDIYMGTNVRAALDWGRRPVTITRV